MNLDYWPILGVYRQYAQGVPTFSLDLANLGKEERMRSIYVIWSPIWRLTPTLILLSRSGIIIYQVCNAAQVMLSVPLGPTWPTSLTLVLLYEIFKKTDVIWVLVGSCVDLINYLLSIYRMRNSTTRIIPTKFSMTLIMIFLKLFLLFYYRCFV